MTTWTITDSETVNPSSNHYDSTEVYSVSNVTRGYTEADSTTYATIYLARGVSAETYMYFDFASDLVPSGATINSLTCQAKAYISTTQTSTVLSGQRKMQMFANGVGKGTEITVTKSTSTISTLSNDTDSWTAQEVNNLSIRLYAKRSTNANNANSTTNFRFYGATLTVNYTYNDTIYNKIYVKVNDAWQEAADVKVKVNGTWQSVGKAYKNINGSWVEQSDKSAMFDPNALYLKG